MKLSPPSLFGLFATVLLFLSFQVRGAVLLQYDFENPAGTATSTANPTTQATGVTGSVFSSVNPVDSDGIDFSTFASDTAQRSIFEIGVNSSNTSALSPGSGRYWDFTVTSSDPLNLTSFAFAIGRTGTNANESSYNVTSSLDGHAAFLSASNFTYSGVSTAMSAPANQTIALSGPSFTNVDASSGVDFRIYYTNDALGTITDAGGRIDTVSLSGAVIPEPSATALLLLGVLTVAALSRRSRIKS